ncbi:hypothetical protein IJG78_03480 [Candidatus Saccharibacteria bacterium]|nr:hypothetical protein [Candidatus Saccharibacteria bacterium]
MKTLKKLVVFLLAVTMLVGIFSVTASAETYYYPGGYVVRTTVETVTTDPYGNVLERKTETYDSPVQYGPPVTAPPVQSVAPSNNPICPVAGGYYYYDGNGKLTFQPDNNLPQPKKEEKKENDSKATNKIADEAKYRAGEIMNYGKQKGWKVSSENVQEADTLVRKNITFKNSKYTMTVEQVTETLWAGGYDTKYKYDGKTYTKDQLKDTLKKWSDK